MITDSQHYSDIADAIREKLDTQETYEPGDMAEAIESISGGTVSAPIEIKEINPLNGKYKKVIVNTQTIPDCAFTGQDELQEVIGENVTSVGRRAFSSIATRYTSTTQIFDCDSTGMPTTAVNPVNIKIRLPNLTTIGPNAFSHLWKIDTDEELTAPDVLVFDPEKITSMDDRAFTGFRGKFKILSNGEEIEPEIINFTNLTVIPENCFQYSKIPYIFNCPILTEIKDYAFRSSNNTSSNFLHTEISELRAPNLTTIGQRAFVNTVNNFKKFWIKSGGSVGQAALNRTTTPALELFTDAAELPSEWNLNLNNITVHYSSTYQDFLDFVPDTETEGE